MTTWLAIAGGALLIYGIAGQTWRRTAVAVVGFALLLAALPLVLTADPTPVGCNGDWTIDSTGACVPVDATYTTTILTTTEGN